MFNLKIASLFNRIDQLESEYLTFLKKIVFLESESFDKAGVDQLGNFIADFVSRQCFNVLRTSFVNSGDGLVIQYPQEKEKKSFCLVAHLDTVHKKGSFPNMLEEKDGYLYGPGVVDCKGGIAVALLAMAALRDISFNRHPMRLLLCPDEEVGNRLSGAEGVSFILDNTKDCTAVITCECGTSGEAVVERKGVVKAWVNITGKAAHSGMHYAHGRSAIREAAYKILQLEKASDEKRITYNCGKIEGGKAENILLS